MGTHSPRSGPGPVRYAAALERLLLVAALLGAGVAFAQAPAEAQPAAAPLVAIVPLGPVTQEYLDRVAQEIQARLHVRVRSEPRRQLPPEAFYAPRSRYRAEKLISAIEATPPEDAWKVVGVTEAEISTTKGDIKDWGIAGLGSIGGRTCVVSSHIYKKHIKTQKVLLRRLGDLAVHEFGHTLGLDHCETKGCVMSDAKGKAIQSADESSGQYCARCAQLLFPEERALLKPQ
jgi:archaemetzincin